jgi:hypothetical protein
MIAIHAGVEVLPAAKDGVGQRRHHGAPNSQACGEDVEGTASGQLGYFSF